PQTPIAQPQVQASGVTCPSCGQPVMSGAKFCSNCGAKLVCTNCGQPITPGAKFCSNCGNKF
ncbi:MAG: zinc-ribbon domain-containing protein, partial [Synergistaceae bacterium]|nr:zinc-ribbon domain-containing protein [Synergistaceae bacterium]